MLSLQWRCHSKILTFWIINFYWTNVWWLMYYLLYHSLVYYLKHHFNFGEVLSISDNQESLRIEVKTHFLVMFVSVNYFFGRDFLRMCGIIMNAIDSTHWPFSSTILLCTTKKQATFSEHKNTYFNAGIFSLKNSPNAQILMSK